MASRDGGACPGALPANAVGCRQSRAGCLRTGDFVPHQVIVKLNPIPGATVEQINATYGSTTLETFPGSTTSTCSNCRPARM